MVRAALWGLVFLALAGCTAKASDAPLVVLLRSEFNIVGEGQLARGEAYALPCDRVSYDLEGGVVTLSEARYGRPDILAIADRGNGWRSYVEGGETLASTWTSSAGMLSRWDFGLDDPAGRATIGIPRLFGDASGPDARARFVWSARDGVTFNGEKLTAGNPLIEDLGYAVVAPSAVLYVQEARTVELFEGLELRLDESAVRCPT